VVKFGTDGTQAPRQTVFRVTTTDGCEPLRQQIDRAYQMNVVYYVDTPPPTLAHSELSSKSSFQNSAAANAQPAPLMRNSSVTFAPAARRPRRSLVSVMTSLQTPASPVVRPPLWPPQLHPSQIHYLVRLLINIC